MVVNRDCQFPLGALLPDHVLIEEVFNFEGLRYFVGASCRRLGLIVLKDRVADRNAFIANVRTGVIARGGDQLANDVLTLMTKGTTQSVIRSGTLQAVLLGILTRIDPLSPVNTVEAIERRFRTEQIVIGPLDVG
jgi:hypothetical protein